MDASSTTSSSMAGGGTSYIILSVSIVGILATALLLLSYYLYLTRCGLVFFWRSDHRDDVLVVVHHHHPHTVVPRGLQGAAIRRIPTFRYHQATGAGGGEGGNIVCKSDCAVCLSDFRHGDRLRQLPQCLHIDCIDAWLQANANCPLCRAAVSPDDHIVIQISHSAVVSPVSPAASPPPAPDAPITRSRRSLSMDSTTDKRFYLALQRMLHQQQEDDSTTKSPAAATTAGSRRLRRSFFSFSHSTILPL